MSRTILVIEDEAPIRDMLTFVLEQSGFNAIEADDYDVGIDKIKEPYPDLILLDWMLPGGSGIKLAKHLKQHEIAKDIPLIMLTARSEEDDKIRGLEAGADDYITKPIKPKVLVSKVKALLRRLKESDAQESEDVLKVGDIVIDREEYKIINKGVEIILPRKEFELLALLTSKPNKVFKREVILDKVWGNEVVVGGRTIDVHIRKLREKIGDDNFKTVKGVGYKFVL